MTEYRHTEAHTEFRAAAEFLQRNRRSYDRAVREFRWPAARHFNWALEWFDVVAEQTGGPALTLLDASGSATDVSYPEMAARSDTVAVWLARLGVRRGERVLLVLDARRELWECMLACLKLGAVIVPAYSSLTVREAHDRVRRGRIAHLICGAPQAAAFTGITVPGVRVAVPGDVAGWADYAETEGRADRFHPSGPTPADDVAFCYFTSGTTGAPKLVAHTHRSYPVGHLSSMYFNGLLAGDRHLNISAPGWAKHSWSSLFVPWNARATIVVPPEPLRVGALPHLLRRHRVDSFCAPPSVWHALRPHLGDDQPRLREATSAGEPLPATLAADVAAAWRVVVRDGYGQTETTGLIGTTPGLRPRPGWLGRPLPGYEISLRDPESGRPGDRGEVCVELAGEPPAGVMAGYPEDAAATARAVGGSWYGTGDLGERDADGWIRIWGRRDDVFKSFDRRISPYELEAVLTEHPSVAAVAVVPVPHPVGGAVPWALVVARRGHAPDAALGEALLAHCAERLTAQLCPAGVRFVPVLPRTASGKVRRRAAARLAGGAEPLVSGTGARPLRTVPDLRRTR
jgi:acetyl-CoA synthetase